MEIHYSSPRPIAENFSPDAVGALKGMMTSFISSTKKVPLRSLPYNLIYVRNRLKSQLNEPGKPIRKLRLRHYFHLKHSIIIT